MSDIGTFRKPLQALPSDDLNEGGTSTTEKIFETTGNVRIQLLLPTAVTRTAWMFRVRAAGRVTGGTTTNFTVQLDYGVAAQGSNTTIETSTARAVNSASHNFAIQATLMWDNTSKKLQGWGQAMVANLYDVEAALAAVPTSVDLQNAAPATTPGFVITGTFSSGNASNVAYLDLFELIDM